MSFATSGKRGCLPVIEPDLRQPQNNKSNAPKTQRGNTSHLNNFSCYPAKPLIRVPEILVFGDCLSSPTTLCRSRKLPLIRTYAYTRANPPTAKYFADNYPSPADN